MGWLVDQRNRLSNRRARRSEGGTKDALRMLRPELRELLARLEGQSRSDLQVTLQLLPLGSRLALDNIGAVKLEDRDPVNGRYRLTVLPFCLDVVNAAALMAEEARQLGHADNEADRRLAEATDEQIAEALRGESGREPMSAADDDDSSSRAEPALFVAPAGHYEPVLQDAMELAADKTLGGVLTDLYKKVPASGPQTPASVAKRTGLPRMTVDFAMYRLSDEGWLKSESPPWSSEPKFSLSNERGLVIGMSLYRDHIHAILTDLRTRNVIAVREQPLSDTSPHAVVGAVAELFRDLGNEAQAGGDVVGLGVVLAGRVDQTGTIYFAPDLQTDKYRWTEVTLEADLEEALRVTALSDSANRVAVENDADALAMYEYLQPGADENVAIILLSESGEGIGAGFVINGGIAHGTEGISGEIGHVIVEPGGKPCRCGARGCLETVSSGAAITSRTAEKTRQPIGRLEEASALVEQGNSDAIEVFAAAGDALGGVLSTVTAVVGARRLVIFGPAQLTQELRIRSAEKFMEAVRSRHPSAIIGVKVDVVPRTLNADTLPTAAAAAAVHYFLSRPRRWMPTIAGPEWPGELGEWRAADRVGTS